MVRLLTTTAIAVGLFVVPGAFAQTNHPNTVGGPAATTSPKEVLDQHDTTFIKEALSGGMAEVGLSEIATKSENAEVKRFAERMVKDHTAANTELTEIATQLGAPVPKTLDSDHQTIRDKLKTVHGPIFDREYMQVMVDDHQKAVKLFRGETTSGHNPQLTQFAQKVLPTIEEHQKMAFDLSRRLSETAAR